ncbi:hypothetical protein CR920_15515 [Stenotrophomonas indicatrix]|uniref:DUF3916 domain-containing protein n=1 Tax=Stenotrophomonas indicatrix TaxID=2045451 RepID=UPI000C17D2D3|nr:DUF3916 domain-containing protein [Stenotrophomonas indicatrix]PII17113.1 hypothetical protein CR920_15515 [Stenotrophomonas indicatrix]
MRNTDPITRPGTRGHKKLRDAPRRLRYLQRWAGRFVDEFPTPEELQTNARYWHYKIPTRAALIEGPASTPALQRACAQALINACANLIQSRPASQAGVRITCCIAQPGMFSSEVCLYLDEDYFQGHVATTADGQVTAITSRSLAAEWGLALPNGIEERGVQVCIPPADDHEGLEQDYWFFGEIADQP